ncbi:MAG: general secretion pathway protein GspC [Proteobacteria bacterium]|nr:general secretion pathway protein GspC [Cystobacterineae bacterium]MCL2313648.1 general secretion pathway protein GspC [Pseudomonadota bacterium]
MFKRNFWLVWLLFLGVAAWLSARLASFLIASSFQITPQHVEIAHPKADFSPTKPQLDISPLAKLLGVELASPNMLAHTAPSNDVDDNNLPRSSLPARLLGTLISFPPQWSLASIQNTTTQKPLSLAVGDQIEGASIAVIERNRVIIVNNGNREYIDANAPGAPPPPSLASSAAQADATSNIRELSPNNYEVPRNELDKMLGNLSEVAMQARIVPAFKDGSSQGFRLYSIRPNSFYQKIGIQNGDIVKRINGFDMNSPEKALELYSKLRDSSRVDLEIERGGASIKKTYNIRAP